MTKNDLEAMIATLVTENRRREEEEFAALRAENPELSAVEIAALQAENRSQEEEKASRRLREEEAELIRLDEEDRLKHSQEYARKLKQELRDLDEEMMALERNEAANKIEGESWPKPGPEEEGSPEDLRETWQKEDRLGGYDPVTLDEFGQTSGRMPSLV